MEYKKLESVNSITILVVSQILIVKIMSIIFT